MANGALIGVGLFLLLLGFFVLFISLAGILLILLGLFLIFIGAVVHGHQPQPGRLGFGIRIGSPQPPPSQVVYVQQPQPIIIQQPPAPAPPQVYLHCKYCGALNSMNPSGNFHCTSCGATL